MLLELNKKIKKYFPKDKVVFGGSQVNGENNNFSDIDVYIVCNLLSFFYYLKNKNKLRLIKNKIDNERLNLHFMLNLFFLFGLYYLKGVYFEDDKEKKFFAGSLKTKELNSLKLSLKHLILYRLATNDFLKNEAQHNLKKNFFFLTENKEEDISKIESELKIIVKKIKTFYLADYLFYCFRFKKIMPINFESIIIDCLFDLNNFIKTKDAKLINKFNKNINKLSKIEHNLKNEQEMFKFINNFVFLIFII